MVDIPVGLTCKSFFLGGWGGKSESRRRQLSNSVPQVGKKKTFAYIKKYSIFPINKVVYSRKNKEYYIIILL